MRVEHRGFVLEGLDAIAGGHTIVRGGWDSTIHFTSNPRVDLDGDRARLRARLLAIHTHRDGGPAEPYVIANAFTADAVRTPAGWRFCGFEQRTVWSSGQSHLDVATSEE